MISSLNLSKPICVVEPHADDAFLSVGAHIEEWSKDEHILVSIWTIFSGTRKRAVDAQAYAKAVKVPWHGSGLVEGEPLELELDRLAEDVQFILPLALTHPEHKSVRARFEDSIMAHRLFYYLDQPYAITQKNGPLITELLQDMRVVSYRKPGVRKYRHIPLFKDQAKFYHYNPAEKLVQTCELLVTR